MKTNLKLFAVLAAFTLLVAMGAFMFTTLRDENIIIDEDPHIGAGYSYLAKGDFRINPEHPPLMKDLGAFPLLFMGLNEPWNHKSWVEDLNGQWEFGRALIFGSGNNADAITFAAKVPMVLFTLAFGLLLWLWTRRVFGNAVALLATFFYAFSPTFLAHGRFVTTDVGASAGFFAATVAFLWLLKHPSSGDRIALAGIALGFAFLTKFSTFMLIPIFAILAILWLVATKRNTEYETVPPSATPLHTHMPFTPRGIQHAEEHFDGQDESYAGFWKMIWKCVCVIIVAYLVIYPLYWHHTRNYPSERQRADTVAILESYQIRILDKIADAMEAQDVLPAYQGAIREFPKNLVIWASDKTYAKPYAEYFLGLLMVFQRSAGGNTTYFLGEINNTGFRWYFPVVYALKEPLAFHILSLIVIVYALSRIKRPPCRRDWIKNHFIEIAFGVVIAFYWWASVRSILNIGVRHVLPTFPFIYILVALGVTRLWQRFVSTKMRRFAAGGVLGALVIWQGVSVASVWPSYLAYYNEIAGGPSGGYQYAVDSNLDWGQELKRLTQFADARSIAEINLDYFGWADAQWYLGDRFRRVGSCDEPKKGWVAVSASFYQGSREKPECDYRRYLILPDAATSEKSSNFVTDIGHSIFVFYVE